MAVSAKIHGPDFSLGVLEEALQDKECLLGHIGAESVLLVRQKGEYHAIGAHCTHYQAPLKDGLVVGDTIHCPWHHACFDLKTGEATKAPALNPLSVWNIEVREGKVFVIDKRAPLIKPRWGTEDQRFVIIGAGAAGTAAAVMLRRQGFQGRIDLISEDKDFPYDRPRLSKDFLSGETSANAVSLYGQSFYTDNKISLELGVRALKIDSNHQRVLLSNGKSLQYDRCLIATGGTPVTPPIPGIHKDQVYFLRTLQDSRRIIARTSWSTKVVIVGAGFIGLEVAASLRARNLEVHVVALEETPLMKVVGIHVGSFLKHLHESKGVHFHLGHTVKEIRDRSVLLDDGKSIDCDFVIVGTGIHANTELAEQSGCHVDGGVLVDPYLETSLPGVFAAGDIAKWSDPHSLKSIRVEHWEVAERQGQTAALNMLGDQVRFQEVPFFWTQHYDVHFGYLGHSTSFDRMEVFGEVGADSFVVAYYEDLRVASILTVGRERESLEIEEALAHYDDQRVAEIIKSYEKRFSEGRSNLRI